MSEHLGPVVEEDLRAAARRRLLARRGLAQHLLAYATVNLSLVVVWVMTGGTFFWPVFPILGWGIGVAFHVWDVYAPEPTERQVEAEMERLRRR
ncbi:2TM domain-containing protein [Actinotalea solisilvae]|uniref:2TM domain-containing protein n=1 Tax=Actinotalea solisilvae TaxID=2072922 RepID=UPI0018F20ECA|nr:2TM domain-containing protein [Actinotalea solisilvae]